uniref:Cyclic nucleotide-binding domain-containing protein n=1 Tax=Tetradesmus obliquus TaxID=3088 RepID=A0A383VQE4_TETOB|eukprot:jgi/Sobl393_1/14704/SZX67120.1
MPHLINSCSSPWDSNSSSPNGRWQRAAAKTRAASSAAEMTAAARLKVLQKTPLPMVIARMKVLLERLHTTEYESGPAAAAAAAAATTAGTAAASLSQQQARPLSPHSTQRKSTPQSAGRRSSSCSAAGVRPLSCSTPPRTPDSAKPPGSRAQGRRSISELSMGGGIDSSGKLSAQTIVQELEVIFGFVSEFLAKVPAETRVALAAVARLESYKKDQLIYDIGQQASNFYIILSGRIDIWSHPPGSIRPKSIVSVLRKGDTFGDQAIINQARHSTAASNASLLVVSQEDFLQVFGPYFQDVATTRTHFLTSSMAPLLTAQHAEVARLCSAMVSSKPPPGKEFDLQQEQVFFIKEGVFELQLVDLAAHRAADAAFATAVAASSASAAANELTPARRNPSATGAPAAAASCATTQPATSTLPDGDGLLDAAAAAAGFAAAAGPGLGGLPALAQHGVLASVRVKDGRALGTLGYERELRRQRHASVPRRAVAMLGPGSWFGGGSTIYGSGQLLLALRVVARGSGCELIHLPLDGIAQQGGEGLIGRLRDDAAFSLTYHLGRLGLLPPGASVGHPQAALLSASAGTAHTAAHTAAELYAPTHGPVAAAAAAAGGAGVQIALAAPLLGTWGGGSTSSSMPATPKLHAALRDAAEPAAAAAAAGVGPPVAAAAACGRISVTSALTSCASGSAVASGVLRSAAASTAAVSSDCDAAAAAAAAAGGTLRRHGRQRQKHVHVAGSGVYSPATMAALQHVSSLQAQASTARNSSSKGAVGDDDAVKPAAATAVCSSSSSRPASPRQGGSSSSRPASSINPRASVRCSSILATPADAASTTIAAAAAAGGPNPSKGASPCSGAVTAAERYWALPGHASSGAAAGLSPLLSSLFTDGLQPLVHEIDGLLDRAQARGRPASAAARLQQPPFQPAAVCGPSAASSGRCSWGSPQMSGSSRLQSAAAAAAGGGLRAWQLAQQQQDGTEGGIGDGVGCSGIADVPADVLQHKPYSSLLAATVMWQRSSDVSVRLPLRQCLTTAEIEKGGRLV